jgi:hypothetical protein
MQRITYTNILKLLTTSLTIFAQFFFLLRFVLYLHFSLFVNSEMLFERFLFDCRCDLKVAMSHWMMEKYIWEWIKVMKFSFLFRNLILYLKSEIIKDV